jgi:hypothetical protein
MVMYRDIKVDIHEEAVQAYIRPGGEVNDLLWEISRDTRDYSASFIMRGNHMRSRRLLNGLYASGLPKPTGALTAVARAGSRAKHTIYFHDGTRDGITGHPHLVVPKRRGVPHTNTRYAGAGAQLLGEFGKGTRKNKGVWRPDGVRGQRSKPFLRDGLRFAMAKHGLVSR